MLSVVPPSQLTLEVTFDSPSLNVGLSIYETTTGSPVLVSGPTLMAVLIANTYFGQFTPVAGKQYVGLKAVYTDAGMLTLDSNYSQASESFICEASPTVDKNGYSLSPAGIQEIFDAVIDPEEVIVSPTDVLVFNNNLKTWNVDETNPGSIGYHIVDDTHLGILMPSTADAMNGDHIIFKTPFVPRLGAELWFYIILAIDGVQLVPTGSWMAGPSANYPWIYVNIATGNDGVQNANALMAALAASADWAVNGMISTLDNQVTFRKVIDNIKLAVDGVWDVPIAAHQSSGSTGEVLAVGGSGGSSTDAQLTGTVSEADTLEGSINDDEILG